MFTVAVIIWHIWKRKKVIGKRNLHNLATTVTVTNPKLQADTGSLSVKAEEILQSELGNI